MKNIVFVISLCFLFNISCSKAAGIDKDYYGSDNETITDLKILIFTDKATPEELYELLDFFYDVRTSLNLFHTATASHYKTPPFEEVFMVDKILDERIEPIKMKLKNLQHDGILDNINLLEENAKTIIYEFKEFEDYEDKSQIDSITNKYEIILRDNKVIFKQTESLLNDLISKLNQQMIIKTKGKKKYQELITKTTAREILGDSENLAVSLCYSGLIWVYLPEQKESLHTLNTNYNKDYENIIYLCKTVLNGLNQNKAEELLFLLGDQISYFKEISESLEGEEDCDDAITKFMASETLEREIMPSIEKVFSITNKLSLTSKILKILMHCSIDLSN